METIKNAANYVAETVQGSGAEASKEANKVCITTALIELLELRLHQLHLLTASQSVAKDGNASLGSRATAAKDALGDKVDQTSHNTKADVHKEVRTQQSSGSEQSY